MSSVSAPLRVSLDTPALLRAGVEALLSTHRDRVTVLAARCHEHPDVEIFDPSVRSTPGDGAVPLVALMHARDAESTARALALGAVRVLHLDVEATDLVATLEEVGHTAGRVTIGSPAALSSREAEVIAGICRGSTNVEIAADLYLSVNSVKTYIRSAYRKIKVSRRSQAVLWGLDHGYDDHLVC